MNLELVKQIADAVLYEGYLLYPYRASAVKNRQRFNFGLLVPDVYRQEQGGSEASTMRTELLIEGDARTIDMRVRFLQLVSRDVFRLRGPSEAHVGEAVQQYEPVPSLEAGGQVHHTWQEAIEREVVGENVSLEAVRARPRTLNFSFGPRESCQTLYDANSHAVGKLVRHQHPLQGTVTMQAESYDGAGHRLAIEICNTTTVRKGPLRDEVLLHSLASTHTIVQVHGGNFVSLLDPPESLAETAAACRNVGTWPVLVGNQDDRDTMLSSPIILYDYPQVAPESRVEFLDGTEIDEMLALRVMTLTEAEKCEMQQLDDRARQILERTESLPPEQWQKLHGAIRGMKEGSHDSGRRTTA